MANKKIDESHDIKDNFYKTKLDSSSGGVIIKDKVDRESTRSKERLTPKEQGTLKKYSLFFKKIIGQSAKPEGPLAKFAGEYMGEAHAPVNAWALKKVYIAPDFIILDIGCGAGHNIQNLAKLAPKGMVYGVDISKEMIKKASERNQDAIKNEKVIIQYGNVERLPFEDNIFDLITAFVTVHYWPDPLNNYREVFRILKPGGSFLVVNNNFEHADFRAYNEGLVQESPTLKIYSCEEYQRFHKNNGFVDVRVFVVESENWICILGKRPLG